jgi:hypothetical protein
VKAIKLRRNEINGLSLDANRPENGSHPGFRTVWTDDLGRGIQRAISRGYANSWTGPSNERQATLDAGCDVGGPIRPHGVQTAGKSELKISYSWPKGDLTGSALRPAHAAVNLAPARAVSCIARYKRSGMGCIAPIAHLPLKFHNRRSGVTSWPCVPPGECFPGAATLALCAAPQRARGSIQTVGSRANALAATITPTFGGPYSYTERGTNSPSTITPPNLRSNPTCPSSLN